MTELELKLSLPERIASQARAAGLPTSEAIERLVREAIRKQAAQRLLVAAGEGAVELFTSVHRFPVAKNFFFAVLDKRICGAENPRPYESNSR